MPLSLCTGVLYVQEPEQINCNGEVGYYYTVNGSEFYTTNTSAEFYLDGAQSYTFQVKAVNADGKRSRANQIKGQVPELGKMANINYMFRVIQVILPLFLAIITDCIL